VLWGQENNTQGKVESHLKKRLTGELVAVCSDLVGRLQKRGARLFSEVHSDRTSVMDANRRRDP